MGDKWISLAKDMITLFMFITAPFLLIWKGLDAWGKRKTATVKDLENRVAEVEKCCKEIKEKTTVVDTKVDQTLNIVLKHFQK